MEVQKHPHHVLHKKNWGEYLLEFAMLFLAVFLGFVAENIRERSVERHRADEYIASFYEDLQADTAKISWNIAFDQEKAGDLEDLGSCYATLGRNASCLLRIIRSSITNRPFIRNERTLKQLNTGGFRLLNPEDADSIIAYDQAYGILQDYQSTVYQDVQNTVRNTLNRVGNFKANVQLFKPQQGKMIMVDTVSKSTLTEPLLLSTDKTLLNEYFNELELYYRVTYNHQIMLLALKEEQVRLLGYLKRKYDF